MGESEVLKFGESVLSGECPSKNGLTVYYSNRCPFTECNVKTELTQTAAKRNMPLTIIKLETMEQAQSAPTPATIFSLFLNGKFVTTDLSICLDNRFEKYLRDAKAHEINNISQMSCKVGCQKYAINENYVRSFFIPFGI